MNTVANEEGLGLKYRDMIFFDEDEVKGGCDGMFKVLSSNLQYVTRRGITPGFRVLVKPLARFDVEDDSLIEQYDINIKLHKKIADVDQAKYGARLVSQAARADIRSSVPEPEPVAPANSQTPKRPHAQARKPNTTHRRRDHAPFSFYSSSSGA